MTDVKKSYSGLQEKHQLPSLDDLEPKDMILGDLENDELNESMKKIVIKFSLPPGAYATNIIKGLFENYD